MRSMLVPVLAINLAAGLSGCGKSGNSAGGGLGTSPENSADTTYPGAGNDGTNSGGTTGASNTTGTAGTTPGGGIAQAPVTDMGSSGVGGPTSSSGSSAGAGGQPARVSGTDTVTPSETDSATPPG
jgi:hypothetical protein